MPTLFTPLTIRSITLKNRIAVSPMCQYSSTDGKATDWHLTHLGSRAAGGAALVICEATAVQDIGRISPGDAGLWQDNQIEPLHRINQFILSQGAIPGIQLAHAGRKASTCKPWDYKPRQQNGLGEKLSLTEGGWQPIAPSAIPFSPTYPEPREMTLAEIKQLISDFRSAAQRSLSAGYQWLEIHGAHGYLINSFMSPLSNKRTDQYGNSFQNRIRILIEIAQAIREIWPEKYPLGVRISASDWAEGGWAIDDSIELAKLLKGEGVDLIDCSSGGLVPHAKIPIGPGYQVPFAEQIRSATGILTGAVGMITEPEQANSIIESGKADIVLLAREFIRDPYWPIHAAIKLGEKIQIPEQYERGFV
jgi:2,4-dienoyl-CoA reductase-like NADH-dependent reductase (Old Yellow Enzyme family)